MRITSYPSLFFVAASVILVACSSEAEPQSGGNGVNDVRGACEIRAGWTRTGGDDCIECLAQVQSPACGCEAEREFIAMCLSQHTAKIDEPTCDGVSGCVFDCGADCACVEACYDGKDACRTVSAAADGCTADVCDAYCR